MIQNDLFIIKFCQLHESKIFLINSEKGELINSEKGELAFNIIAF